MFLNSSAEQMFEYKKKKELLDKNIKLLMTKEYAEKHDSFLQNYNETGKTNVIGKVKSIIAVRKSGKTFAAQLSVAVTTIPSGHLLFIGTIHELKKLDPLSTIRENANYFSILDNMLDLSIVIDEKTIVKFINRQACTDLGYQSEEVIGRNVNMLMSQPFQSEHDSYVQSYINTGQAKVLGMSREVVAQAKNGQLLPVNLSLTQTTFKGERIFIGILRKTNKEDQTLKSILQIEREVLDSLIVSAIIMDKKGIICGFNKMSEELFGYSLIEVIGKNVKMLMPSPERDYHDQYIATYLKTGKTSVIGVTRNVLAQHKNGSLLNVLLSVTQKSSPEKTIFTGIFQVQ